MKDLYLAVGQNSWGKGWTLGEALAEWAKNTSSTYFNPDGDVELRRFIVPEDATFAFVVMDDMGGASWAKDTKVFKSKTKAGPIRAASLAFDEAVERALPDADYEEFLYGE